MQLRDAIEFRDPVRAGHEFSELTAQVPSVAHKHLESLLGYSPDPDRALQYLVSFSQRQPEAFQSLASGGAGLQYLVTIFSFSHFLSEDVLQHPDWLNLLVDLDRVLSAEEYGRY